MNTDTPPDLAAIAAAIYPQATLQTSRSVAGGSIHAAWQLETSAGSIFLKTNSTDCAPQFAAEAAGLAQLAATQTVRVPAVLGHGSSANHAWLALEWLDLRPLDHDGGALLGKQLAALHSTTQKLYGLDHDNYIGNTPQHNEQQTQWARFFAQQRLQPQLERAIANGLDQSAAEGGLKVLDKLTAFFLDRRVVPALIHGDLWSGNVGMLANGTPVIFDPAIYYGDHEADLAMAELFGGFPESFYAAYRSAVPLAWGFEQRKTLYNLYHMLNHYNLFGASYHGQVKRMIGNLLEDLRR